MPLPAAPGWLASLVVDNGTTGIWTVGTLDAFALYGCPDIFGLDDRGRCLLLSSYSGKWTAHHVVEDGAWLGALSQLDLDPSVPGPEIYTGGQRGRLVQIVPLTDGGFDVTTIARFAGREIHTLIGGELLPGRPGRELLAFTGRGATYLVLPDEQGGFSTEELGGLQTRVRQAVVLPHAPGTPPWIAAACRNGEVALLRLTEDGLERRVILSEPMGFGRLALAPPHPAQQSGARPGRRSSGGHPADDAGEAGGQSPGDEPLVLYVTRDDGLLLRLAGRPEDPAPWRRELVYAGPQGLRGVAAGRFDPDPEVETVAVFGYSHKVQLLSRRPGTPWTAQTLFVDRDKGHWLASAELDGRNGTDELIASGYGGRIVLLARAPGCGLPGVPTDPDPGPHLQLVQQPDR